METLVGAIQQRGVVLVFLFVLMATSVTFRGLALIRTVAGPCACRYWAVLRDHTEADLPCFCNGAHLENLVKPV
jgi:hypothetical protein